MQGELETASVSKHWQVQDDVQDECEHKVGFSSSWKLRSVLKRDAIWNGLSSLTKQKGIPKVIKHQFRLRSFLFYICFFTWINHFIHFGKITLLYFLIGYLIAL